MAGEIGTRFLPCDLQHNDSDMIPSSLNFTSIQYII